MQNDFLPATSASDLVCPVCQLPLAKGSRTYTCQKGHSFDRAREGYVNLLIRQTKGIHGDNRAMLTARRDFLDKGYYAMLSAALAESLVTRLHGGAHLLDAGCGEGYYSAKIMERAERDGKHLHLLGIDISKEALRLADKRQKNAEWAVGSLYSLPVRSASQDAITCLFAPLSIGEFYRTLKPNGILAVAVPDARHLFGLKSLLYDTPYENEVRDEKIEGFVCEEVLTLADKIRLTSQADMQALFGMTPYAYRTSAEGRRRLSLCTELETEICFKLFLYRRDDAPPSLDK